MKTFRPMLACPIEEKDLPNLIYPVAIQPKIDGIRCVILNGHAVTRTLKPIPNKSIRTYLEEWAQTYKNFSVIDGELVCGNNMPFQYTTSVVMSHGIKSTDFKYIIFDVVEYDFSDNFTRRFSNAVQSEIFGDHISILVTTPCMNPQDVLRYETFYVTEQHYEGLILRSFKSPYKFGRSTLREQYLMKLKRFKDSEAIIIGFLEKCINNNPPGINVLGYMERGHSTTNMIPCRTLGALIVEDCVTRKQFNIGSGFKEGQRSIIWHSQTQHLGKIVKYKYQEVGMKNLPRAPIFLEFRID